MDRFSASPCMTVCATCCTTPGVTCTRHHGKHCFLCLFSAQPEPPYMAALVRLWCRRSWIRKSSMELVILIGLTMRTGERCVNSTQASNPWASTETRGTSGVKETVWGSCSLTQRSDWWSWFNAFKEIGTWFCVCAFIVIQPALWWFPRSSDVVTLCAGRNGPC